MAEIFEAISKTMAEVGAVAKTKDNTGTLKYKYRGIDAVMNALHPAMTKNGIFCSPEVLEQTREERESRNGGMLIYSIVKVKYTFYAKDGSNIVSIVIGEGMDSGDKATNKAMSAAFKYACFQVFCIPTDEMKDSEEESPEVEPKTDAPKQNNAPVEMASEKQIGLIRNLCGKLNFTYEKLLESNNMRGQTPTKKQASEWIEGLNNRIKAKEQK